MPSDPRDYKLDLSSAPAVAQPAPPPIPPVPRPYLSVHFTCCGVYQRIYRHADGAQYAGRCPRCGKAVRFPVGPGGTSARTFTVS